MKNRKINQKEKAFTLIELLAVLVILAVIALIAVPIILGIVEQARKDAFVRSTELVVSSTDIDIALKPSTEGYTYYITDGVIEGLDTVEVQNTKGMSGSITYNEDGVASYVIHNDKWCVTKNIDMETAEVTEYDVETCKGYYTETLLHGADPVLKNGLVPVTIEGTEVKKANRKEEWYNYSQKNWANAVILFGEDKYEEGQVIPESDIKQYYVWIPRYRYKLWNVNSETGKYPNDTEGPSAIEIIFENKGTKVSNGTQNGEYLTHPAFTAFNTNGLWVGKFETSYNESTFTDKSTFLTTNTNTTAVTTALESKTAGANIIIKPNVRSLTLLRTSQMYEIGREINPSVKSHMMKNMEWGAVAYLTYSLYGKCDETSCEEVYINNITTGWRTLDASDQKKFSSQWDWAPTITGCSAATVSAAASPNQDSCASGYTWNEQGVKASTTGNRSGIYDMSGGTWEYMMAVITDSNGNPVSGRHNLWNSGYNGIYGNPGADSSDANQKELTTGIDFPLADKQYYDLYAYNYAVGSDKPRDYSTGHLGDATKEIAPTNNTGDRGLWFTDYADFASVAYPWFGRGGDFNDSVGAGVLYFNRAHGNAHTNRAFRVVLAY